MRGQPRWCPSSVCLWHSALEAYLQSFESQIAALNDFGVVARQHHQCNCVPVTATSRISSNSMILFLLQGGDYSEKGDAWGVITRTGRWSWWSWWSWVLSEPRPERLTTFRCCLDTSFDDRLQTVSRGEILSAFRCFWFFGSVSYWHLLAEDVATYPFALQTASQEDMQKYERNSDFHSEIRL